MTDDLLPKKLRRLAFLTEQGEVSPRYADRLDNEADRALRLVERDKALQDLARLMPGSSRWEVAGRVAEALERFQAVVWPRLQVGTRPARTDLERRLAAVLQTGPAPCQRIVWQALKPRSAILEPFECARAMATG